MRRASAPAICLKVTWPLGLARVIRFCSFSTDALSANAASLRPRT